MSMVQAMLSITMQHASPSLYVLSPQHLQCIDSVAICTMCAMDALLNIK